ncbi:MAG: hypothetical protein GY806_15120 [Gammaproteobacteria bacterium]|nr:hypothetical protein [Gammaproteobacteria bacterium]
MRSVIITLVIVFICVILSLAWVNNDDKAPFLILVVTFGALGGVIRETLSSRQKLLEGKSLSNNEILLVYLSPLFGAVLAVSFVAILLSGFLSGDLFPKLENVDGEFESVKKVLKGGVTLATNADFYLMIVWSIISGYSEKFVVSKFDSVSKS